MGRVSTRHGGMNSALHPHHALPPVGRVSTRHRLSLRARRIGPIPYTDHEQDLSCRARSGIHVFGAHGLRIGVRNDSLLSCFGVASKPCQLERTPSSHNRQIYAPRFLSTFGRPHAVALHFAHCGQLATGLAPVRVRPCWAHQKKEPRGLFLVVRCTRRRNTAGGFSCRFVLNLKPECPSPRQQCPKAPHWHQLAMTRQQAAEKQRATPPRRGNWLPIR